MLLSKPPLVICLLGLGFILSLSSCGILHQNNVTKPVATEEKAPDLKASDKSVNSQKIEGNASTSQVVSVSHDRESAYSLPLPVHNEDLSPLNSLPPVDRHGLRTPSLPRTLPMDLNGRLLPKDQQ